MCIPKLFLMLQERLSSYYTRWVAATNVIHSDGWRSYHGLVDLGYNKHFGVDDESNEFVNSVNHVYGIERLWG